MLQRIQTLFLFGVVLISIALYFLPFSEKASTDAVTNEVTIHTLKLNTIAVLKAGVPEQIAGNNYVLLLMDLLILALTAYTIFQYKNRPLQIRMCMLGGLLTTVFLVLVFFYSEELEPANDRAHYLAGVYLLAVEIILFLAARRFIRKDEMLVRSADRIR